MPANLENSAVPTGLENVSFHSSLKERQCQRMLKVKKVKEVKSLSRVRLFATQWTIAYQAPQSMGFSRQEYWSGVPLPSPFQGLHTCQVCKLTNLERSSQYETITISTGKKISDLIYFRHYQTYICRRQWHPTLVLLPGKSHGRRSLEGCSPWDRTESDTTEATQQQQQQQCHRWTFLPCTRSQISAWVVNQASQKKLKN